MSKITRPWNWFLCLGKPSAVTLAQRELEAAQRELLDAQSGREYASAMCQYHEARVRRLRAYIQREHASANAPTQPLPTLEDLGDGNAL